MLRRNDLLHAAWNPSIRRSWIRCIACGHNHLATLFLLGTSCLGLNFGEIDQLILSIATQDSIHSDSIICTRHIGFIGLVLSKIWLLIHLMSCYIVHLPFVVGICISCLLINSILPLLVIWTENLTLGILRANHVYRLFRGNCLLFLTGLRLTPLSTWTNLSLFHILPWFWYYTLRHFLNYYNCWYVQPFILSSYY